MSYQHLSSIEGWATPTVQRSRDHADGLQAGTEQLARLGWPVMPCHYPTVEGCSCGAPDCSSPAKHPYTLHGLHDATTDMAVIRRWWRTWPHANVAARTGSHPDGAGLIVLDVDPAHGGNVSLAVLTAARELLPVTLEVATGGGGRHLYFRHPGHAVPNSVGRLGPGLDVRADGGYVLVPPSRHLSGGEYRWQPAPIAALPTWLDALMATPPPRPNHLTRPHRDVNAWAAAALAGEVNAVRTSLEGRRNHALNRAAFSLGQLVGAGYLEPDDVTDCLADAAIAAGLGVTEIRATISSGLRAGAAKPRHPAR